jgi:hypothetical protein
MSKKHLVQCCMAKVTRALCDGLCYKHCVAVLCVMLRGRAIRKKLPNWAWERSC